MASKRKEKRKETYTEELTISKYIKTTIILVIIIGFVYLGTTLLIKAGVFDEGYTPSEVSAAVFTYETTLIGSVFNKADTEYYVVFYDSSKPYGQFVNSLVKSYREKDDVIPLYTVDMSKKINNIYASEESNKKASKVEELKIKDETLIKIKNGKNILYMDNIEEIYDELVTKYKDS